MACTTDNHSILVGNMSDINKVALTWRLFFETKDLFKKYIFLEFEYFISLEYYIFLQQDRQGDS